MAGLLQRRERLGRQHIDDRIDKGPRQVGPVLLAGIGQLAGLRQHRGLQPREGKIEIARMQHRPRQRESARRTELCQPRHFRAAGIAQAQQLGSLVEGLARGIVQRFAQQRVVADAAHFHQLRMPAGHQQRHEREGRRLARQQRRQQVAFQVVHADHRHVQRKAQRIGHRGADQQRAGKARALGEGDGVDVLAGAAGIGQHLFEQRQHTADMVARGEFGHHAPIVAVHGDLRVQRMREQAGLGVVEGQPGFVAGRFDAEDKHGEEAEGRRKKAKRPSKQQVAGSAQGSTAARGVLFATICPFLSGGNRWIGEASNERGDGNPDGPV
ncbi:hypothetical protein D3C72_1291380 [compost metagenome]